MRRRRSKPPLPVLFAELFIASAETIAHRAALAASGKLRAAERQRMLDEKIRAAQKSGLALMSPRLSLAALIAPWHRAARRNAKRLRRR
jgi:hypothetical protein